VAGGVRRVAWRSGDEVPLAWRSGDEIRLAWRSGDEVELRGGLVMR
jgi:hypothetical protein